MPRLVTARVVGSPTTSGRCSLSYDALPHGADTALTFLAAAAEQGYNVFLE
jgi:hypothetical protein